MNATYTQRSLRQNAYTCSQPSSKAGVRCVVRHRRPLVTNALLTTIPKGSQQSRDGGLDSSTGSLKVIGLISALADVQAQVHQFEVFAGRSAMIGFIVALTAELLTERSIFRSVGPSEAVFASGILLVAVTLAAVAAASTSKKQLGLEIKEAVITSLTAAQRSAASVTGKQVDRAVDHILNKVFDMGVIYSLLADEDI